MIARMLLIAVGLTTLPLAQAVGGGHCLLSHLHKRHCCEPCELHIHYCPPPSQAAQQPQAATADAPSQLIYSPIMQSAPALSMPMMPMMQMMPMPMMMPYPCPQPLMAQQPVSHRQASGCGDCEPRIDRLESGVKQLSERMDKMEEILVNQTAALKGIRDALDRQSGGTQQ